MAQDVADWQEWKRVRKVEGQRYRRTKYRRIDYIDVSEAAAVVIDREVSTAQRERRYLDLTYSAVLNRIVTEWEQHRNKVQRSRQGMVK
jgi:DNA topoisomerase IA